MSGRRVGVDASSIRSRPSWVLLSTVLLLGLSSTLAAPAGASHGGTLTSSGGFVMRDGETLLVDGEEFRFTGLNVYNANSDGTCGSVLDLDQGLDEIGPGKRVMRAWFFQGLATSGGVRDWSRFDATLAIAEDHGVKVIPVLANQWGDCEQGYGFKTKSWYEDGYETIDDPDGLVTYREWVAEIVDRYKDNPTVAFWQLINEAEIQNVEAGDCSQVTNAADTLETWAADVSGLIKSLDTSHLVSLGTIGGGQCGTQGSEYQDVHSLADIDLCEYHDYGSPNDPLPGDEFNGFLVRVSQCAALDKPLFVGEAGIIPNEVGGSLQARAEAFAAKLDAQFGEGIVGFLAWAYTGGPSTLDNYDIGAGDPTLDVLALDSDPPAYDFSGFFAPVDNPDTLNVGKAGKTYPIAFRLNDANGNQVTTLSAVAGISYQNTNCAEFGGDPTDSLEALATGQTGLRYDTTADHYVYNWKTPSQKGCYTLFVIFDNDQVAFAYFQLK